MHETARVSLKAKSQLHITRYLCHKERRNEGEERSDKTRKEGRMKGGERRNVIGGPHGGETFGSVAKTNKSVSWVAKR
jgi:hypothetical protein